MECQTTGLRHHFFTITCNVWRGERIICSMFTTATLTFLFIMVTVASAQNVPLIDFSLDGRPTPSTGITEGDFADVLKKLYPGRRTGEELLSETFVSLTGPLLSRTRTSGWRRLQAYPVVFMPKSTR